jgi:hypothetical protein
MGTDLLLPALAGVALSSLVTAGAFLTAVAAGRYALRRFLGPPGPHRAGPTLRTRAEEGTWS